ncbi:MAG: copper chaperone PCu(A)C [Alphaproteobacteria bacterium]|nr:copper chaperone PCu(A)C [Alphaproteobacteria bacterium]
MMIKPAITLVLLLFMGLLATGATTASAMDGLKTSDVEIRATAPGMTATGGYLTIHNHSGEADRLVGVTADFAAKAEIHTMIHENGVMKMRALRDGIEIPAGGMVELAPGGLHLMLMGLTRTLQAGQMLEVELTFASGKTRRLSAHVKRPDDIAVGDGGVSGGHNHSQSHSHSHSHSKSGS